MPEISALGWFHTALGIIALTTGALALIKYKEITLWHRTGQIYVVATLITASTALAIYQFGEFGPGHLLAVMTLAALLMGLIASQSNFFGAWSRHAQAVGFTGTLLFHCIPAVTDGLMRLPVSNPIVSSIADPILRTYYAILLVLFLVGVTVQLRWISRHPTT